MENGGKVRHKEEIYPQLLANIYLNEFDQEFLKERSSIYPVCR